MQQGIHPEYKKVSVSCACGNVIETHSTRDNYQVEVCSACHPVFTGEGQKILDSAGRVERFRRKYAKASQPDA